MGIIGLVGFASWVWYFQKIQDWIFGRRGGKG